MGLPINAEKVKVELHLADENSIIIPQNDDLSVDKQAHFVTLVIESKADFTVLAMSFEQWQKLTTHLYQTVDAGVVTRKK